jgi:hypothetical protein
LAINVRSAAFPHWAALEPPSCERPYWSEEDGTRHAYRGLVGGADPATARLLRDAHLDSIRRLAEQAIERADHGDQREARRLATAAGRLCGEVIGLWPASVVAAPRS